MVNHKKIFSIVFLFLILPIFSYGQYDTVVVFFKDKPNAPTDILSPLQYLSQHAIERRYNSSITIDSIDVPVNADYIQQLKLTGAEILYTLKWFNAVLIRCPISTIPTLTQFSFVRFIDDCTSYTIGGSLEYTAFHSSMSFGNSADVLDLMGIPEMHRKGLKGNHVRVGVLDSGFSGVDTLSVFNKLFKNNQIVYTYDVADNETNVYNDHNHGTLVFSVLAADSVGYYVGGIPKADYVLLRTEIASTEHRLEEYHWVKALEIADSCGVSIINSSLGYYAFTDTRQNYPWTALDGETTICANGARYAFNKGILIINSAGNEGQSTWKKILTPGDSPFVLTVGAVDAQNQLLNFSSVGPNANGTIKPNVVAIGNNFPCVESNGQIRVTAGTSLSTPLITSLAVGMKQAFPQLQPSELITLFHQASDQYEQPDNFKGYGIPYFEDLYERYSIQSVGELGYLYPNPTWESSSLYYFSDARVQSMEVYSSLGQQILTTTIQSDEGLILLPPSLSSGNPGIYQIVFHTNKGVRTVRWIKY